MSTHHPNCPNVIIKSLVMLIILLFPASNTAGAVQQARPMSHRTTSSNPDSLTDGLVAYYSFDDGTATDRSGNMNNGIIRGNPGWFNYGLK
jgi:hypothetical protein